MAKFLKSLVFFGLIFAVTFFALRFFQGNRRPASLSAVEQPVEDLKLLERELTVLEQAIWERRKSGAAFADEEEAKSRLVDKIESLKKEIEAAAPSRKDVKTPDPAFKPLRMKWGVLDGYQLAVLGGLAGALLLSGLVWSLSRRGGKNKTAPGGARRDPRVEALKANLEKFKSKSAGLKKETVGMDLSALRSASREERPAAAGSPPAKKPESLESKVASLSKSGAGVKEISEKLRIDEDRVRLILKFKPPSAGADN